MPKKPIDYSSTFFYKIKKICCNDLSITDCCVGHTTNFRIRKNAHKSVCNNKNDKEHNNNVYKFVREHGGWENWSIIEVDGSCSDFVDACKHERHLMESLNATLNQLLPTRTDIDKKKGNSEKCKKYRVKHKEQLKFKNIQIYLKNKEAIKKSEEVGGIKQRIQERI